LKKPAGSVRFRFYKQKTKKTEPKPKPTKNQKKTEPNRKNQAKPKKTEPKPEKPTKPVWTGFCPKKTEPKPVGLTRFRFFFKKKNSVWLLFLIKSEPNRKWSPLTGLIWNFMVSDWLWLGKVLETLAHLT